ncbi:MAG: hypothetical protein U0736_05180 [Gemmataceae bacterium]
MKWRKLGRVFCPEGSTPWMASHAAVPFAEPLDGHTVRVHFSSRDTDQRSQVGWVDVDLRRPTAVVGVSPAPVLGPGRRGFFDDSGAMLCWIARGDGGDHLYYIGWNLGVTVPFRNALGLAIRAADGTITRHSCGPVLDRGPHDPCFVASACVLREPARWRMWYLSCVEWTETASGLRHRYHLKYAESADGVCWRRDGIVCIDFRDPSEYAISRPSVVKDADGYRMWYSYRGAAYRIGYATSADGVCWQRRDDEAGIDVSPTGWDAGMIEYPHVFDHAGGRYMLYNGDGYGRTGFGLAVLEQD